MFKDSPEGVKDTLENVKKCICGKCPTHSKCMKERGLLLFCARVKSTCEVQWHGCICPSCPVAKENDLHGISYCKTGKKNMSS